MRQLTCIQSSFTGPWTGKGDRLLGNGLILVEKYPIELLSLQVTLPIKRKGYG